MKEAIQNGTAEGFHLSHFPQGHGPTRYDKYWETNDLLANDGPESVWKYLYEIEYENNFEPYVVIAATDVPLYDERFCGYGLNKVSHLKSIAKSLKYTGFSVLPGVFLVAPFHERSESWRQRYGPKASTPCSIEEWQDTQFSQLWLKGLYCNFETRLKASMPPVVSTQTQSTAELLDSLIQMYKKREQELYNNERPQSAKGSVGVPWVDPLALGVN